jgi:hypothetical protein
MSACPAVSACRCPAPRAPRRSWKPYAAALAGAAATPAAIGAARTLPGTVNAAIVSYLSSAAFAALASDTRAPRRRILERFRVEHGDKRVALLQRAHIGHMVAAKASTPGVARNFLSARAVMAHCVALGWRDDDPTQGVKRPALKSGGITTWTEDNIAAYEAYHPVGTMARKAEVVLLYTGQRRSDVIRLGRQHLRDGFLQLRQQKTGAALAIPVHPALAEILSATPSDNLTFLTTAAANRSRPRASPIGSAKCAMRPACPAGSPRMACARRHAGGEVAPFSWSAGELG